MGGGGELVWSLDSELYVSLDSELYVWGEIFISECSFNQKMKFLLKMKFLSKNDNIF